DDLISTSFAGDNETLTTAVPQGVAYNRRVYKIIQEMYQKAGWNVTLRCGDRDGDYFEVKPYRPRPETERTDSAHLRDR
ncbi:MAG TPA: hypothetical protein VK158_02125, partial [Acidobacteriota bacterium]|nr:hypothetical protein [Acidobacteriota bacterium]